MNATIRLALPAMALLLAAHAAQAAVVRLKDSAASQGAVIRLGDVADIEASDPQLADTLRDATLAPGPALGGTLQLDFATIRARLQAQGVDLRNVEFSGSSRVAVQHGDAHGGGAGSADARKLAWQQERAQIAVAHAIQESLQRRAPELGGFSVDVQVPAADVAGILGAADGQIEVSGGSPPWTQPQSFSLSYRDRRRQSRTLNVTARIVAHPQVLALRHPVPAGHILQPADLVWRQSQTDGRGLSQIQQVVGHETKRTLRQDEIVQADDIQAVPLVRSGDIVTVFSRRPGIAVKRHLKARSEGTLGDTVTLVTFDGRQTVLARVTGLHEAEVFGAATLGDADRGRIRFLPQTRETLR